MNWSRLAVSSALKLLPVLLLLIAQTSLLLHELDYNQHQAGDTCMVCLGGHGLGGALPSDAAALTVSAVADEPRPWPPVVRPRSLAPLRLVARSPPHPALPA